MITAIASWLLAAITEAGKLALVVVEAALAAGAVISLLVDPEEEGTTVSDFTSWSNNFVGKAVLP